MSIPVAPGPISGRVTLPGSKSFTNRALPIAALATGVSTIHGALDSDDTRYMVAALQELGIAVEADWNTGTILVSGANGVIPATEADLFLGNSGTSMRFLTALVALGVGRYRLDGNDAMRTRPIGPLIEGLRSMGVDVNELGAPGCPPLEIVTNGLPGETVVMPGDLSSQYFSALAMVAPYARGAMEIVVEGELVSKPYIDLTADAMAAFGVTLRHDKYQRIWVEPDQKYHATEYNVEPDASAASYFFALAAVTGGSITVERLPSSSAQGDTGFVDVLESMGCRVDRGRQDITVRGPDKLQGVDVDMNAISDTVMTLAAIAPFANCPTTIRNIGHIRLKETDRLTALATELGRLGIATNETPDSLTIYPGEPQPAIVQTYDDHRIAMSYAITGVKAPGIRIADPMCVRKTVPRFWDILFGLIEPSRD
ncbi:MAG: 3-phosphoshikimate 1-carboxyvinyltransferase [Chloroflexia bacterium]|nr:3-phosphoshikimate 1-carboxyvinyltransferase [Chloroflexia bacterium]